METNKYAFQNFYCDQNFNYIFTSIGLHDAAFRKQPISKEKLNLLQNMLSCFANSTIFLRTPWHSTRENEDMLLNKTVQNMKTHLYFSKLLLNGWEISSNYTPYDGHHYTYDLHEQIYQIAFSMIQDEN